MQPHLLRPARLFVLLLPPRHASLTTGQRGLQHCARCRGMVMVDKAGEHMAISNTRGGQQQTASASARCVLWRGRRRQPSKHLACLHFGQLPPCHLFFYFIFVVFGLPRCPAFPFLPFHRPLALSLAWPARSSDRIAAASLGRRQGSPPPSLKAWPSILDRRARCCTPPSP